MDGDIKWGEFTRLWVCIDIMKPLLRRKKLNVGLDKPVWVSFTYERLSDLCFYCGMLRHGHRDYFLWAPMQVKCEKDGFSY